MFIRSDMCGSVVVIGVSHHQLKMSATLLQGQKRSFATFMFFWVCPLVSSIFSIGLGQLTFTSQDSILHHFSVGLWRSPNTHLHNSWRCYRYHVCCSIVYRPVFRLILFRDTVRCVVAAPVTRMAGAISLWSVEIIMQLRIYALFNRSKKVRPFKIDSKLLTTYILSYPGRCI